MSLEKIRRFKKHYTPKNIIVSITGNLDIKQVKKIMNKCLPELSNNKLDANIKTNINFDDFTFTHKSKQAIVKLVYKGTPVKKTVEENFVADLFHGGFGHGMHSLLFDKIREELGLCYTIGSAYAAWVNFGYNYIQCMLDKKNIDIMINEALKLIEKVKKEGFSDTLFDVAKKQFLYSLAMDTQTSTDINRQYIRYFALDRVIPFEEERKRIEKLKNADIIDYANKMFDTEPKIVKMIEE
jgi:predicted Zn-dependent peptidase